MDASQTRDRTYAPALAGRFLTTGPSGKFPSKTLVFQIPVRQQKQKAAGESELPEKTTTKIKTGTDLWHIRQAQGCINTAQEKIANVL